MNDVLILASASPRRRELLELLGIEFEVRPTGVEEVREGDPATVVRTNALLKARAVAGLAPVLGADTDVAVDGRLLGKAESEAEARSHLGRLAGREHEVLGGVALVDGARELAEVVRTTVRFRPLADSEIDRYVASEEWRDRAGAYAVQGLGSALVERIEGDLSNVIGLPIPTVCRMIAELQNRK